MPFMHPFSCGAVGQNEEICYCLKAWNDLPHYVRRGERPNKDDAMKVGSREPHTGDVFLAPLQEVSFLPPFRLPQPLSLRCAVKDLQAYLYCLI